jgi:hypothetical protein
MTRKKRILLFVLLGLIISGGIYAIINSHHLKSQIKHQFWDVKKRIRKLRDSSMVK